MKLLPLLMIMLVAIFQDPSTAQQPQATNIAPEPTSMGIIITSNDEETIWNVLRLANYSITNGDTVTIFLLGKGVELDGLLLTSSRLKEQVDLFRGNHGSILACGTCLQSRNNPNPKQCSISTMGELYDIVRKNKIVLTF
ncbi:MAG: DsrE family protein [Bacteroidia bacterium]|nr:DsrE family protein [Bacteroidia bacterium]